MPKQFNPTDWITTTEAAELMAYSAAYLRQLVEDAPGIDRGRGAARESVTCS